MIIFQVRWYNIIGLELDSIERRLNKKVCVSYDKTAGKAKQI